VPIRTGETIARQGKRSLDEMSNDDLVDSDEEWNASEILQGKRGSKGNIVRK
jgi:hypothetical protein